MSLIKCPECGKEISDKALACPYCGYPIENKEISNNKKTVFSPKKCFENKKILVGIAVLSIAIVYIIVSNIVYRNPYKSYMSYIGKNFDALPDEFQKIEVLDGDWLAVKDLSKDEAKFSNVNGEMQYMYSEDGIESLNVEPYEIHTMIWKPEYTSLNAATVEKEKDFLEKFFGGYDKKTEVDNSASGYSYKDDDFLVVNYIWKNKSGKDITLRVELEGNDYKEILLIARKAQDEE